MTEVLSHKYIRSYPLPPLFNLRPNLFIDSSLYPLKSSQESDERYTIHDTIQDLYFPILILYQGP